MQKSQLRKEFPEKETPFAFLLFGLTNDTPSPKMKHREGYILISTEDKGIGEDN